MSKVKKAIIPVAGLGTRFLPATKTVPKEMFPIVDTPILYYIVEEAVRSGIEDIILITGRNKSAIADFFDSAYEVEDVLAKSGQSDMVEKLHKIRDMANIISVRQKKALGLGHAVLTGAPIVGNEPFAVLLGDEIMFSPPEAPTVTKQLMHIFNETGRSCVAVMQVERDQVSKYGIVAGEKNASGQIVVTSVVEKPSAESAPSLYALPGRYVFAPEIFTELKNVKPGRNNEIQLTDAMTSLAKSKGLIATEFQAERFDAGDKLGYLQANIELALKRNDIGPSLKKYIQQLARKI